MLGIENYGSDDDGDNDSQQTPAPPHSSSYGVAKLPRPSKKSTFSLSPPTNSSGPTPSSSKPSSGLALPPPKAKKGPKKIAIGLPALPKDDDESDERPPAKRARVDTTSALLSMLPAPKNKVPILETQERVLGGGRGPSLVFNAPKPSQTVTVQDADDESGDDQQQQRPAQSAVLEKVEKPTSIPFLPPHLAKGKANVSVEEKHELPKSVRHAASSAPAVDFFSLGSSKTAPSVSSIASKALPSAVPSFSLLPGISSAPKVDDFTPPEPTPQDPYPGYYLLPSGSWAAHDPEYYRSFYVKWQREYDAHVRALEKGKVKGFEGAEAEAEDVNAARVMEKAKKEIQDLEERKALTNGAMDPDAAPKMNIKGAALGGRARTRHQLSTLLTEAYQNREALEERIAQGRKNRKEAGNKYGF